MAAFSRGCRQLLAPSSDLHRVVIRLSFHSIPCRQAPQTLRHSLARRFHESSHASASSSKSRLPIKAPKAKPQASPQTTAAPKSSDGPAPTRPPKASSSPPAEYNGFTKGQLESIHRRLFDTSPAPRLIYHGPRSNRYIHTCFGLAALSFAWAGTMFYQEVVFAPPGLSWYAQAGITAGSALVLGAGVWLGRNGMRHVQRIWAVPTGRAREMAMRLEIKSVMPFRRARVFDCPVADVSVSRRIAAANRSPWQRRLDAQQRLYNADRNPFLMAATKVFTGSAEFFAKVWAKEEDPWKVEVAAEYWPDPDAMDRLARLREDDASLDQERIAAERLDR